MRISPPNTRMNGLIAAYPKPLVALGHGIVMGGGIGIAGHCRFRLTQPGARFAMPEAAIGFFSDVGVNAILAQGAAANRALLFLMSGVSVGAADALALGLADRVVAADRVDGDSRPHLADAAAASDPRRRSSVCCRPRRSRQATHRSARWPICLPPRPARVAGRRSSRASSAQCRRSREIAALLAARSPSALTAIFYAPPRGAAADGRTADAGDGSAAGPAHGAAAGFRRRRARRAGRQGPGSRAGRRSVSTEVDAERDARRDQSASDPAAYARSRPALVSTS